MLYLALARLSFRRMLAYRAATLAGLGTNFFFGMLRAFIFIALFDAARGDRVAGYDLPAAITYTALTQAFIAPVMIWGSYDVMQTIRTGQIAGDLTRPLDFQRFWLAQDVGRAVFNVAARGVTIMAAYALVFDLTWPSSAGRWLVFAVSAVLAVLASFGWRFLVNLAAFWTVDAVGVGRMAFIGVLLFSGLVVPLGFMPPALQTLARALPFAGFMNTPSEIFLGIATGRGLAVALGLQLAWTVALIGLGRVVYGRGVRRLIIQGG